MACWRTASCASVAASASRLLAARRPQLSPHSCSSFTTCRSWLVTRPHRCRSSLDWAARAAAMAGGGEVRRLVAADTSCDITWPWDDS